MERGFSKTLLFHSAYITGKIAQENDARATPAVQHSKYDACAVLAARADVFLYCIARSAHLSWHIFSRTATMVHDHDRSIAVPYTAIIAHVRNSLILFH
jgi:hypothetical protein